jgi:hypothetical protein
MGPRRSTLVGGGKDGTPVGVLLPRVVAMLWKSQHDLVFVMSVVLPSAQRPP